MLNELSEDARKGIVDKYRASIGLPANKLKTVEFVKAYTESRNKSLSIFTLTPGFNAKYTQHLIDTFAILDQSLEQIGSKFHPDELLPYLQAERTKAMDAIKLQQSHDQHILKKSSTADPSAQAKALADVAAAQKAELEAFEKGLNERITALHQAAQMERDRIAMLGLLRNTSKEMQRAIDAEYLKGTGRTTISMAQEGEVLKDLSVDQFLVAIGNKTKSVTGNVITVENTPNGRSFKMDIPNSFFNFTGPWRYHSSPKHLSKVDWLLIASMLKASGAKSAVVNVDGFSGDQALGMKMLREGYEAAREVGFPEDKITVNFNGKKLTHEELFKELNTKQATEARADVAARARATPAIDQGKMKSEMNALRSNLAKTSGKGSARPDYSLPAPDPAWGA